MIAAAIHGKTWQHGKPAFKRPLSAREVELAHILAEQERLRSDGTES